MSEHEVIGTFTTHDGAEVSGRFVTPAGLAHRLGVTVWTVFPHLRAGHIKAVRLANGRYLIRPREATRVERSYRPGKDWAPRRRRGRDSASDT